MSPVLVERFDWGIGTIKSATEDLSAARPYLVKEASSYQEAHAFALDKIPEYLDDLPLSSVTCDRRVTPTAWDFTANYGIVHDDSTIYTSFDASAATVHVDTSLSTRAVFGPKADATQVGHSNVIEFNPSTQEIKGVDKLAGAFSFSMRRKFDAAFWTDAYKALMLSMPASTNLATFSSYARGCVLFTGATASQDDHLKWEITYNFQVKKFPGNYYVGDVLVSGAWPWDHVWTEYETQTVGTVTKRVPVFVHVEVLYPEADFSQFGLE